MTSPPRDQDINSRQDYEETVHVTTKTVTMNERFHGEQEDTELRGYRGGEDEESELLRDGREVREVRTYSA